MQRSRASRCRMWSWLLNLSSIRNRLNIGSGYCYILHDNSIPRVRMGVAYEDPERAE